MILRAHPGLILILPWVLVHDLEGAPAEREKEKEKEGIDLVWRLTMNKLFVISQQRMYNIRKLMFSGCFTCPRKAP